MKNVKYYFWDYLLYDFAGVEERLSALAAQGWYLDKIGAMLWKFRKGEPRAVTYAVTYVPEASEFNASPTKGQRELETYCEEAGWTKVADWFQMQIYATEQPSPLPLETDEKLRLITIHRSMRKNYLPSSILLAVIGVMLLIMQGSNLLSPPSYAGATLRSTYLVGVLDALLLLMMSGVNLGGYYFWYRKSGEQVERGGGCARASFYRGFNKAALTALLILMIYWLGSMLAGSDLGMAVYIVGYMAVISLLTFLLKKIQRGLKRFGLSRGMNIFLTLLADLVLAFIFIGILIYVVLKTSLLF